jgi:hypothetical protein
MNTNHTPEPWRTRGGLNEYFIDAESVCTLAVIGSLAGNDIETRTEEARANASRIVSCVNGCKGITDPEKTVPELARSIRATIARINGEWDNPDLVKWGDLSAHPEGDILFHLGKLLPKIQEVQS